MGMAVVFFSAPVEMKVGVRLGIMGMGVQMELLDSEGAPQNTPAKNNQHHRDQEFQTQSETRRDRQAQSDDEQADNKERSGMSQTPECPDQRGPFKAVVLADDRRDSDHVIRIQGMFNTEDQTENKSGVKGSFHGFTASIQNEKCKLKNENFAFCNLDFALRLVRILAQLKSG